MKANINVFVEEYGKLTVKEGSTLLQVAIEAFKEDAKKYLGARIENEILPLFKNVEDGQYIKFLTNRDVDGYRIYTKPFLQCLLWLVRNFSLTRMPSYTIS